MPPAALLENSKAALMLSGLMPSDGTDPQELRRRLFAGRYSEIRMLYFLGKDVFRWIEQCGEWVGREPELRGLALRPQSFAGLLTGQPPPHVTEKLVRWGVADHSSIFSRAIGLNAIFAAPPGFDDLAEEFLANYHRFADAAFRCYLELESYETIGSENFRFELYASGEYSRLLESGWGAN
jgi:hypothetical protein